MFPKSTLCVVIHWGVSNLQAATFIKESNAPPSQQLIANISSIKGATFGFLHNPCWNFDRFYAKLQLLRDKVWNSHVMSRRQHFTALFPLSWLFNFSVSSLSNVPEPWLMKDRHMMEWPTISSVLRIIYSCHSDQLWVSALTMTHFDMEHFWPKYKSIGPKHVYVECTLATWPFSKTKIIESPCALWSP